MKNPKCIICKSSKKVKLKFEARANLYDINRFFKYWYCSDCITLFRQALSVNLTTSYDGEYYSFQNLSKKELIKNYLSSFFFNVFYYTGYNFRKDEDVLRKTFKKLKLKKNVKILDVGCGNGQFLSRLSCYGYKNLVGFDPYYQGNYSKIPIFNKKFENVNGSYDFINAHHVIEHVENPIGFLNNIMRLLSKNGIAIITFPKYGKIVELDEKFSYLVQAPDHKALYSEKSFEKLCAAVKLKIKGKLIDSSGTFNWLILGALWKKGIYEKTYRKKLLSYFNKFEINKINKMTQEIEEKNQGSNIQYILKK